MDENGNTLGMLSIKGGTTNKKSTWTGIIMDEPYGRSGYVFLMFAYVYYYYCVLNKSLNERISF